MRFSATIALIEAFAGTKRIDSASVVFGLWMNVEITVHIIGRSLKNGHPHPHRDTMLIASHSLTLVGCMGSN